MSDKILTEAFDKLKAIEEAEDPFCIGAKDEDIAEAYTEVNEDNSPHDGLYSALQQIETGLASVKDLSRFDSDINAAFNSNRTLSDAHNDIRSALNVFYTFLNNLERR